SSTSPPQTGGRFHSARIVGAATVRERSLLTARSRSRLRLSATPPPVINHSNSSRAATVRERASPDHRSLTVAARIVLLALLASVPACSSSVPEAPLIPSAPGSPALFED